MSCSPITLHKSPSSSNVNSIPGITKPVVFKFHAWLITCRFTVTFDNHAMQARITEIQRNMNYYVYYLITANVFNKFGFSLYSFHQLCFGMNSIFSFWVNESRHIFVGIQNRGFMHHFSAAIYL